MSTTDFTDGAKRGEDAKFAELGFTESQNGEHISVEALDDGTIQVEIRDSSGSGWYISLTTDEASYLGGLLHGTALKIVGDAERANYVEAEADPAE